jgi:hypothetical protein
VQSLDERRRPLVEKSLQSCAAATSGGFRTDAAVIRFFAAASIV